MKRVVTLETKLGVAQSALSSSDDDGIVLTPKQEDARKKRSIAIALSIAAFVVLIFAVTIVRLGGNVLDRPL